MFSTCHLRIHLRIVILFWPPHQRERLKKTTLVQGCPGLGTLPSGEHTNSNGKSPFLMGKSTISMAICNCYVSSPEGTSGDQTLKSDGFFGSDQKYQRKKGSREARFDTIPNPSSIGLHEKRHKTRTFVVHGISHNGLVQGKI